MRNRSPGRTGPLAFLAGILWCCLTTPAFAHAPLTGAVPADGAVIDTPPKTLSLSFSGSVSPLVLKLVLPDGQTRVLDTFTLHDRTLEITTSEDLATGTHVLTWRVVSEDGHPVAGSTLFSIGAPGNAPQVAEEAADGPVKTALWLAKIVLYAGLFFGIGGIFALRWLIPGMGGGPRLVVAATLLGLARLCFPSACEGLMRRWPASSTRRSGRPAWRRVLARGSCFSRQRSVWRSPQCVPGAPRRAVGCLSRPCLWAAAHWP
ncbi:MAG: copper resistance CopC family protein [Shinella sp.]|uniref:copper resistance CopC family protein n=1 Tax=Shinella sp. TaxID=1870904 RepID=UPI004035E252